MMKMWSGIKHPLLVTVLVICIMSVPAAAQLADTPWPMFHHDPDHTGLSTGYGPDTSAVNWTFSTGGRIYGSVAIGSDGVMYVGTRNYLKPKTDSKLYAIYPNGTEKWCWTPAHFVHFIDSTPAVAADGTIYIGNWDRCVYAIYPNGTEKWVFRTHHGGFVLSSPVVAPDGTIYIGNHNCKLYAIHPNGTEKWNFPSGGVIQSSPAIGSDGTVYIGSYDKKLYAIYPNGTEKWNHCTGCSIRSSPAIDSDGTIYVGSNDKKLYAINPDGTLKWSYTTGGWIVSSPAIDADGTIYVGSNDGKLYAIYPDGTLKWSYTTSGRIKSSPAIDADGTIYVGSKDGHVYAINQNGTLLWNYHTGNKILYSSPAIAADGTAYIGNWGGDLYAFGPGTQPPGTPNMQPVLDPVGDRSINETETVTIDLDATDPDGDSLTYSCNRTDLFSDFDPVTGRGNWSTGYGDSGTYFVCFGVSDGNGGIDNETIRITVLDANQLPVLDAIGSSECRKIGEQFDVLINITPLGIPLMGAQFDLHFNASALKAETVMYGNFLIQDGWSSIHIPYSDIDNVDGVVEFAATRQGTSDGVTCPETFAIVHFTAETQGVVSELNLTNALASDNATPVNTYELVTHNDTVEVCLNTPPDAVAKSGFTYNNIAGKGLSNAYFIGTDSDDPDGNITDYRWWVDDGSSLVGEVVEHLFVVPIYWRGESEGYYVNANVTLTVTDDGMPLMNADHTMGLIVWISGDATGDGRVNIADGVTFGMQFGNSGANIGEPDKLCWEGDLEGDKADLNNDGRVNIGDAMLLGTAWGCTAW